MKQSRLTDEELHRLYQPAELPDGFDTAWRAAVRREEIMQMSEPKMKQISLLRKIGRVAVPVLCALVLIVGAAGVSDFAKTSSPTQTVSGASYTDEGKSYGNGAPAMKQAARASGSPVVYNDYADADVVMEMEESAVYDSPAEVPMSGSGSANHVSVENVIERKLVRTADLTIRTTAYDNDLAAVEALLKELGGYTEYRYESGDKQQGSLRRATLTMRVPSAKLDEFLSGAEVIGRVTEHSESAVDMTTQYYDNQTRLDTLYKKMERLQQMMAEAAEMSDLIELESAISDTQYEIDSYETMQRTIQSQVDMSAVTLTLREETEREQVQARQNTLGERIAAAFSGGLGAFGDFLQNVLVFLVMALPVIALIGVIIVVCVVIRKNKKNRAQNGENK